MKLYFILRQGRVSTELFRAGEKFSVIQVTTPARHLGCSIPDTSTFTVTGKGNCVLWIGQWPSAVYFRFLSIVWLQE